MVRDFLVIEFFGLLEPTISALIDHRYSYLELTHLVGSDRR